MKKLLQLTCLVVALMMLASCAAVTTAPTTVASAGAGNATTAPEPTKNNEPPAEVNCVYLSWAGVYTDLETVNNAINDNYLVPKLNIKLKLTPINGGSFMDQTNLLLAGGDPVDLLQFFGRNFQTTISSGQIVSISDSLDKYGPDLKKAVDAIDPGLWNGCSYQGKIYCMPETARTFGVEYALKCRQDLCDKYSIPGTRLDTIGQITDILKQIKDNEPGITPLGVTVNNIIWGLPTDAGMRIFSNLGFWTVGVVPEDKSLPLKVENYYETPEYKFKLDLVRSWAQAGYIDPNSAVMTADDGNAQWNAGKVFARLDWYNPGWPMDANTQYILLGTQGEPRVGSGEISIFGWVVPHNAINPDNSIKLLNELWTNHDLTNLVAWGIEGTHYVKTGADANQIDYPAGVAADTVTYKNDSAAAFGDFFNCYYLKGSDAEIAKHVKEFNATKKPSRFLSFNLDPANIKTEMAAVDAVIAQYAKPLEMGAVDPATELPKFISALKSAGIETCMAEFQKQIEAWAAQNEK
jgi:putative aldouronate transport system substrate-binding protein